MGIQGGELFTRADFHPVYQAIYIAAEQGVQHQHRQRKIVNIIIVFGDFQLDGVMLMNFGQHGYVVRIQNIGTLFQRFPNFRLNKEAVGADFFVGIGKSIQADDGGALFAQKFEVVFNEFFGNGMGNIQIHLLLIKSTPYFFAGAVGKFSHAVRRARFAFVNQVNLFVGRLAVRPELFIADKQVAPFGIVFFLLEVLEIRRLGGNVVDHKVKH